MLFVLKIYDKYTKIGDETKESSLIYFPTFKISQDHLEIFFGKIQMFGRCNNNPTSEQFKFAYKKLLIHVEVNGNKKGNCVLQENSTILQVSSSSSSLKALNDCTVSDNFGNDEKESPEIDEELDLATNSHYNLLIKSVNDLYYTIRYCYHVKNQNCTDSPRTMFNKLTLFKLIKGLFYFCMYVWLP